VAGFFSCHPPDITMVGILTFFTNPTAFYRSLETSDRLKRGMAILSLSILTSIGLSFLYYGWKVSYEIFLPNPIPLELPTLKIDYLIMSNLTSIFITAVILLGVGRIAARLTRARHVGLKSYMSAIFHGFILLALVNTASAPAILYAPNEVVYVVGAEMENVAFFNVTVDGVVRPSGEAVHISRDVLTVSHVDVGRFWANGTRVVSNYVNSRQLAEVLNSTTPFVRFSGVMGHEAEISEMDVRNIVFDHYITRRTVLGEVLVLSETAIINSVSGINSIRNIVWRALLAISMAWSLRALHNVSKKTAVIVTVLTYLILANLAPSPF